MGVAGGERRERALLTACAFVLLAGLVAATTRPVAEARTATSPSKVLTSSSSSSSTSMSTSSTATPQLPLPDLSTAATAPAVAKGRPKTAVTQPPATPEAPPVPPEACGTQVLRKADGSAWRCSFADNFDGTALDTTKWTVQTTASSGFHNGSECFVDDPDNVAVSNGNLQLTVRQEKSWFTCDKPKAPYTTRWTSGMVMTFGKWAQTYGRFEVRAKMPPFSVPGLQTSFWLWPTDPFRYGTWPASGEIDWAEWYSVHPDRVIPYIHYLGGELQPGTTNNYCMVGDVSKYHTYTLEWTSEAITIMYDGQTCLVSRWVPLGQPHPQPFDQPFTVALTQALGRGKNVFDANHAPVPATAEIDYLRVWK